MNRQLAAQPKTKSTQPTVTGILQRKCACGHHASGGECEECWKKNGTLQRKQGNGNESTRVPPLVHEVLRSSGQPLDADTRSFMESRFGRDFSEVRVHSDSRAAESAASVNALAYTVGRDVAFASGRYSPGTDRGRRLLAHELAHVVQQSGTGQAPDARLELGRRVDPLERAAEQVADRISVSSAGEAHELTHTLQQASPDAIPVVQRQHVSDNRHLQSKRFAGNQELETVLNGRRILRRGNRGPAVELIQRALLAKGYSLKKGADGIFGSDTEATLKQFQRDTGARVDGLLGDETMGLLDGNDSRRANDIPETKAAPPGDREITPKPAETAAPTSTGERGMEGIETAPEGKSPSDKANDGAVNPDKEGDAEKRIELTYSMGFGGEFKLDGKGEFQFNQENELAGSFMVPWEKIGVRSYGDFSKLRASLLPGADVTISGGSQAGPNPISVRVPLAAEVKLNFLELKTKEPMKTGLGPLDIKISLGPTYGLGFDPWSRKITGESGFAAEGEIERKLGKNASISFKLGISGSPGAWRESELLKLNLILH